MRHGMALNLESKMKYLTAPYLTLMHAFKNHADNRLDHPNTTHYHPTALMQEYCTLRLDGGRQTGKTEAVAQFADEWLEDGGTIIVLGKTYAIANDTKDRIIREHTRKYNPAKSAQELKREIITSPIRQFLSDSEIKFRGQTLQRILFIIDEPMHVPEMHKFYSAYHETIRYCNRPGTKLPLFFVIGIQ